MASKPCLLLRPPPMQLPPLRLLGPGEVQAALAEAHRLVQQGQPLQGLRVSRMRSRYALETLAGRGGAACLPPPPPPPPAPPPSSRWLHNMPARRAAAGGRGAAGGGLGAGGWRVCQQVGLRFVAAGQVQAIPAAPPAAAALQLLLFTPCRAQPPAQPTNPAVHRPHASVQGAAGAGGG